MAINDDPEESRSGEASGALPPRTTPPAPELQRLNRLVGTWDISGRTPDASEDNIRGRVTIRWLPGGHFMEQRGEIEFADFQVQSLELIWYDPLTDTFASTAYTNLGGTPESYHWDVRGNVVTHWDEPSKYSGLFNDDATELTGGWRPQQRAVTQASPEQSGTGVRDGALEGQTGEGAVTYDAVMKKVE